MNCMELAVAYLSFLRAGCTKTTEPHPLLQRAAAAAAQCRFTPGICSVAAFIHFFRCCRRWGSSTTSRWKVPLGKAVLVRLIELPIVHARVELVDDSTCLVTFSTASKLACCRGRHADADVQLEVGGDILTACEAILKLSCMFRCSCRMLILACCAAVAGPVIRPNALDDRRRYCCCCLCSVHSVHELPRNGSDSLAAIRGSRVWSCLWCAVKLRCCVVCRKMVGIALNLK